MEERTPQGTPCKRTNNGLDPDEEKPKKTKNPTDEDRKPDSTWCDWPLRDWIPRSSAHHGKGEGALLIAFEKKYISINE